MQKESRCSHQSEHRLYPWTSLFEAARKRYTKLVHVLLEHNANVDVQTCNGGGTKLHVVASIGHKEMVDLLQRKEPTRN